MLLGSLCSTIVQAVDDLEMSSCIQYYNLRVESEDGFGYILSENGEINNKAIEGITYDKVTNTLNLKNVNTKNSLATFGMGQDFTINVEGENSIGSIGVNEGNLTITGTGTLNINPEKENFVAIRVEGIAKKVKLTIEKTVNINLYAGEFAEKFYGDSDEELQEENDQVQLKDVLIGVGGQNMDGSEDAIVLKNGQKIDIKKYENKYENPKHIEATSYSSYYIFGEEDVEDDGLTVCTTQDGKIFGRSDLEENWEYDEETEESTFVGNGYNLRELIYDEELDMYFAKGDFEPQFILEEDFKDSQYTVTNKRLDRVYEYPDYIGYYELAKDANGKEYAIMSWMSYEDDKKTVKVFDILDKTIEIEGKNVPVLKENNEIDGETLTPVTETTKTSAYIVVGKSLEIKANPKAGVVNVESDKEDMATEAATKEVTKLIENVLDGKDVKGIDEKLAKEIKEAVEAGKNVKVEVSVPEVKAEDVAEDAKKIEERMSTDSKVAAYFDINLVIKIEGEAKGNVTELGDKVAITVPMPTDLPKVANGYTRKYTVIRVHDGVAEELDTTVSGDKVLFETDKFSTYALTYKDVKNTSNPQTGDSITLYVSLMMISIVCGAVYVKRKNK